MHPQMFLGQPTLVLFASLSRFQGYAHMLLQCLPSDDKHASAQKNGWKLCTTTWTWTAIGYVWQPETLGSNPHNHKFPVYRVHSPKNEMHLDVSIQHNPGLLSSPHNMKTGHLTFTEAQNFQKLQLHMSWKN